MRESAQAEDADGALRMVPDNVFATKGEAVDTLDLIDLETGTFAASGSSASYDGESYQLYVGGPAGAVGQAVFDSWLAKWAPIDLASGRMRREHQHQSKRSSVLI